MTQGIHESADRYANKYTKPLPVCVIVMCVHGYGCINILQATEHFSISCLGSSWRGDAVGGVALVSRRKLSMHSNSCLRK